MEKIERNCSTCLNCVKNSICKKLSMRVNDRDFRGELKCRYYAGIEEITEKAMDTRA